jgi:hypothetical protein
MISMKWQLSPGMGGSYEPELYIAFRLCPATYSGRHAETGRFRPECLANYARNRWQLSAGTGGKFGPEYSEAAKSHALIILFNPFPYNDLNFFIVLYFPFSVTTPSTKRIRTCTE